MKKYAFTLALIGFTGLFILLLLWHTVLFKSTQTPTAILLIFTITPLLLPLRGFLEKRKKSCGWFGYISLPYFIHGIIDAYSNSITRPYALIEILFSLLLFFGAVYTARSLHS
jgi:uncharacterized membrane protein